MFLNVVRSFGVRMATRRLLIFPGEKEEECCFVFILNKWVHFPVALEVLSHRLKDENRKGPKNHLGNCIWKGLPDRQCLAVQVQWDTQRLDMHVWVLSTRSEENVHFRGLPGTEMHGGSEGPIGFFRNVYTRINGNRTSLCPWRLSNASVGAKEIHLQGFRAL